MAVELKAYSVTGKAETPITVQNETRLFGGGCEVKFHLDATVGTRPISLIEREYDPNYVENWKVFRSVGLPVVPTLRESSGGTLLVTDVKADGSEVYGKGLAITLKNKAVNERERARPDIDTHFLQVTHPDRFGEVEKKVDEYVSLADNNGIALPMDDPFELVVHPDGQWKLMILDLRYGYHKGSQHFEGLDYKADNNASKLEFLTNLKHLRTALERQKSISFERFLSHRVRSYEDKG